MSGITGTPRRMSSGLINAVIVTSSSCSLDVAQRAALAGHIQRIVARRTFQRRTTNKSTLE